MKFFAVFAAVCAVASASNGWTLTQLSSALSSPATDPALKPTLEQALNHVMDGIFSGAMTDPVAITTEAGPAGEFNLSQLEALLTNPNTNPLFIPYIEHAFEVLIADMFAGVDVHTIPLMIPALDIKYMTLAELESALASPATNPAVVPYLEHAVDQLVATLHGGEQVESIVVVVPLGLGGIGGAAPAPVMPSPIVTPTPTPNPVAASSSPLVQIVVNVQRSEDLDVSSPFPEITGPVSPSPIAIQPIPV